MNSGFSAFASKSLDKFNQKLEWAPSPLDQLYTNRYIALYDLPIGPGKKFLNRNTVVNKIVGGWQISTILDYEGGTAFGVSEPFNPVNNGLDRPNQVAGVAVQDHRLWPGQGISSKENRHEPDRFLHQCIYRDRSVGLGQCLRPVCGPAHPA